MAGDVTINKNSFKLIFKYFKQKSLNNFDTVLNFDQISKSTRQEKINQIGVKKIKDNIFGVIHSNEWRAYTIKSRPGVILVRNPFTSRGQRYWVARCLRDFPRKPNRRNIDIDNTLKDVDHLWEHCHSTDVSKLDKLRWATLGYHHNWDTKVYSEDAHTPFPKDLALLSRHVAAALGFQNFGAQAAIVNMYHPGSCLSGHVDNSEVDLDAPLISFSFGQSAIFLIGGKTLEEPATALLLQSGDILLMSREARLCYHAVPRILPTTTSPWEQTLDDPVDSVSGCEGFDLELWEKVGDAEFWADFKKYVSRSRINMNVRQVLAHGQTSL